AMTQEDRLDWHPSADPQSKTRSALDQAAECIDVNRRMAALLRGETPGPPVFERPFADGKEAQEQIRESAKELAEAVRGLDEEALTRIYTTAMGPMPGALLLEIAAGNLNYHFGQINYIQTLYGDTEFHLPPRST
ncbi:MAG TPA: DinB family protein, partial [Chthonomonadaceae bacterium]|nr:DinB family protein [Chthonomonadaceae bacterium]